MELTLTLELPDGLYQELLDAAVESRCTPKMFAAESVESVLASRRLPKVSQGRCGARLADPETALREHRILLPESEL
jgi:hypothetical protein